MPHLEGIIIFFVIVSIITSIANAAKKAQQNNGNQRGGSSLGTNGASRPGAYTGSATSDQRARLEQLRKMQQQRQEQRQTAAGSSVRTAASPAEKPIHPHDTEDCGGGSIHDGYHEGTVRRPAPASSAEGRLGRQGVSEREGRGASDIYKKDWNERKTAKAADIPAAKQTMPASMDAVSAPLKPEPSGAERLSKAIADKPAIVQGLIWTEVLGRPLSDS